MRKPYSAANTPKRKQRRVGRSCRICLYSQILGPTGALTHILHNGSTGPRPVQHSLASPSPPPLSVNHRADPDAHGGVSMLTIIISTSVRLRPHSKDTAMSTVCFICRAECFEGITR